MLCVSHPFDCGLKAIIDEKSVELWLVNTKALVSSQASSSSAHAQPWIGFRLAFVLLHFFAFCVLLDPWGDPSPRLRDVGGSPGGCRR